MLHEMVVIIRQMVFIFFNRHSIIYPILIPTVNLCPNLLQTPWLGISARKVYIMHKKKFTTTPIKHCLLKNKFLCFMGSSYYFLNAAGQGRYRNKSGLYHLTFFLSLLHCVDNIILHILFVHYVVKTVSIHVI